MVSRLHPQVSFDFLRFSLGFTCFFSSVPQRRTLIQIWPSQGPMGNPFFFAPALGPMGPWMEDEGPWALWPWTNEPCPLGPWAHMGRLYGSAVVLLYQGYLLLAPRLPSLYLHTAPTAQVRLTLTPPNLACPTALAPIPPPAHMGLGHTKG